jgi:hypothetical protein
MSCLIISAARSWQNGFHLDDPFHNGEYFASAAYYLTLYGHKYTPITIHGLLDIFPAVIAAKLFGLNNYFLPTWFIYKILEVAAGAVLVKIAFELINDNNYKLPIAIIVALIANDVVGYRDLLLLISFYVFVSKIHTPRSNINVVFAHVLIGVLAALGLFWSFDRGIAGALSLGTATLIGLLYDRKYLISIVSFMITVVFLDQASSIFSISNYYNNVIFLIETSSLWSYGWERNAVILSIFAVSINTVAILLLVTFNKSRLRSLVDISWLSAFFMLSLIMLKAGINRADTVHVSWSMWMPVLMLISIIDGEYYLNSIYKYALYTLSIAAIILGFIFQWLSVFLVGGVLFIAAFYDGTLNRRILSKRVLYTLIVIPIIYSGVAASKGLRRGNYAWIQYLLSPPLNYKIVPNGVKWASDQIVERKSRCVFDLSNSGTINGLSNLPSCTRFTYPVYASNKYEPELIQALNNDSPNAIVYSMNGITMDTRFPILYKTILKKYPIELCNYGYCLRYLKD